MRTGHKVLLIVIALALVLGAIIFFNMRGNNVEAGYMRWAIANNISLFFASPMKFLAGDSASDGNSSPLLYIGIGGIGLVFMLIMLKFTGDGETVALRKRVKELDTAKNEAERALQALLVALGSRPLDAVSCFVPTWLMLRSLNVATPLLLVDCELVPLSVPVPLESAIAIDTPEDETLFPNPSRSWTVIAGVVIVPAVSSAGCWMKAN